MPISTQTLRQWRPPQSPEGQIARQLIHATDVNRGDMEQLQTDLTSFPLAWLERFQQDHLAIAVLKDDQTLADTSVLPTLHSRDIAEIASKGQPLVQALVHETFAPLQGQEGADYLKYMAAESLAEKLASASEQELGFSPVRDRQRQTLSDLARAQGFDPEGDPESFASWRDSFFALNQGLIDQDSDGFRSKDGLYLIPYSMHQGRPVRTLSLDSYQTIRGLDFQHHLGANYPDNHLIVLHHSVLANPSPSSDKHRVVLHEAGHALNWICRELPQLEGGHQAKVEELYELACQREQMGGHPFLTQRASDNAEEMMAEAVEAYQTLEEQPSRYKAENHRAALASNFPELHDYVDYLIHL